VLDKRTFFINLQGRQSLQEIAHEKKQEFLASEPFPHIVIDNLINEEFLRRCAEEFPDLSKMENVIRHSGRTDEKLASPRGNVFQPQSIFELLSFLNSSEFIDFLQELTSIKEPLIPDPHFIGGGSPSNQEGWLLKDTRRLLQAPRKQSRPKAKPSSLPQRRVGGRLRRAP